MILYIIGLLVVILIIILFLTTQYELFTNNEDNNELDIVITWVEDNEEFNKEKTVWLEKQNYKVIINDNEKRYTHDQELKYCLRSIEMYFPYFRYIHLVVKDGQFPKYLNRNHPKLKVVNHSNIIPSKYLPTFNSMAIEAYLHHIPGLTKNYIYMNDDFMFLKHTTPSYFLKNDIPINLYSEKQIDYDKDDHSIDVDSYDYRSGFIFNNLILNDITKKEKRYEYSHVPKIYNKIYDYGIENRLKNYYVNDNNINIYDKTGMSKFRRTDNLFLVSLLKPYLYVNWYKGIHKKTELTVLTLDDFNKLLDKPVNLNKNFLCIQEVGHYNIKKYLDFMNKIYPTKSTFEI